jgi:hypothetical protein
MEPPGRHQLNAVVDPGHERKDDLVATTTNRRAAWVT